VLLPPLGPDRTQLIFDLLALTSPVTKPPDRGDDLDRAVVARSLPLCLCHLCQLGIKRDSFVQKRYSWMVPAINEFRTRRVATERR